VGAIQLAEAKGEESPICVFMVFLGQLPVSCLKEDSMASPDEEIVRGILGPGGKGLGRNLAKGAGLRCPPVLRVNGFPRFGRGRRVLPKGGKDVAWLAAAAFRKNDA